MAALIDEAREVRREARRLRAQTVSLRLSCRERMVTTRESLAVAEQAAARLQARRAEPLPSPWSTLHWAHDDERLQSVLVSVV